MLPRTENNRKNPATVPDRWTLKYETKFTSNWNILWIQTELYSFNHFEKGFSQWRGSQRPSWVSICKNIKQQRIKIPEFSQLQPKVKHVSSKFIFKKWKETSIPVVKLKGFFFFLFFSFPTLKVRSCHVFKIVWKTSIHYP